jgi:hypothetical protein
MTFQNRQPIDEIMDFGSQLKKLGNDHNAVVIKEYGEELVSATESFNIEAIMNLIRKYPGFVDLLKDAKKNQI